jgi:phosphotransferase system HPr-like phosphotransfer protein
MLAWNLNSLHSAVRIVHNENVINGKSLIGILNTYMRAGETITVVVDEL